MPRPRKPPRLYLRKDDDEWIIRDSGRDVRTGCSGSELERAAQALEIYLKDKPVAGKRSVRPYAITVGEVLAKYVNDRGPEMNSPETLLYSVKALSPFWANLPCSDIIGDNCRLYERLRACKPSTVRRELGVLQSALTHAQKEGVLDTLIQVTLPSEGLGKDRWLTHGEAARLVRAAPPHLKRFILVSLYTGRRVGAVLELEWTRVDFIYGTIRFLADATVETNKRRGQVQMPRQLFYHMHRWHRMDPSSTRAVVSHKGKPVASIKTAFKAARIAAGLGPEVTPHTLKHTSVTWAMQVGISLQEAAEFFNTSPETLQRYWHHSPHHQSKGRQAMENRKARPETVRVSVQKRGKETAK